MNPIARQSDQHVSVGHRLKQRCATVHGANGKSREIEIAGRVHPRHLDRFAVNQGAARPKAPFGDAFDHTAAASVSSAPLRYNPGKTEVQPPDKQDRLHTWPQGRCPTYRDDRCRWQCGVWSHPIRQRHENGVFIPGSFEVKQRPEPAQSAEDARPRGPVRRRFDPVHQSVASIDIDTSVVIVDAMALTLVSHAVSQLRAA